MYFDYIKEREGISSIVTDNGFITYEIQNDLCSINDLYIKPEFRQTKEALGLALAVEDVAKKAGCKKLIGFIYPELKGATRSIKVQIDFGFKLLTIDGERIVLQKEL